MMSLFCLRLFDPALEEQGASVYCSQGSRRLWHPTSAGTPYSWTMTLLFWLGWYPILGLLRLLDECVPAQG